MPAESVRARSRARGRRSSPGGARRRRAPSGLARAFALARDNEGAARAARLEHMLDTAPGITRKRRGKSFTYLDAQGRTVRDRAALARIKSLAIPPAWTDVWIAPHDRAHVQATGRDANGRKQYRYHPRWSALRDETKYGRMIAFGEALPVIRERTARDLARPGLPRAKVLAAAVQLLEKTLIRVGNDEYARANNSFGLTTMRDKHADVNGSSVRFEFVGKGGKLHSVDLQDRRLAKVVKRCRDVPGYELFQYLDEDGNRQRISSSDVNDYLREISGHDFTAKDFRTWAGTVLAARALQEFESFDSDAQAKRNVVQAIETVAARLGNTKTVCRKCYVHPAVLDAYLDGTLVRTLEQRVEREMKDAAADLTSEEAAVLGLIRRRLAIEAA
jgi:DNA topoisomerase I